MWKGHGRVAAGISQFPILLSPSCQLMVFGGCTGAMVDFPGCYRSGGDVWESVEGGSCLQP